MKKICFIVSSLSMADYFLRNHILNLSKIYHVDLLANIDSNEIGKIEGLTDIIHIPLRRNISLFFDIKSLIKVFFVLKKNKYTAIHSVGPKSGLIAALAGFALGVENRFHWFTGQIWVNKNKVSRYFYIFIDKVIYILNTAVLIDSQSQKDFLIQNAILYENKCYVLRNGSISGVNLDRFYPNLQQQDKLRKEFDIDPKKIVVLFLGRINKDKGIYDLVCALNVCKSKSSIHLIIVGPDENNHLKKIIKKINKFNIDFSYVGTTAEPEKYYNGADFLCFPSHREGFGLTVIEAAGCQIPTIGSDIYGLQDAIRHGETGILFNQGNIKELAAAIDKLSQDADFRLKLGENARRYALQKFEQSIVTNSLLDFYQFFINKHNNNFSKSKILHVASLGFTLNLFVKPFENFFSNKGYNFIYLSDQDTLKKTHKELHLNRGKRTLIDIFKSFTILLNIIREKPDVIHFHTPSSALSLLLILKILKRLNIFLVYTSRGDFRESEIRTRRILYNHFDPIKWQLWDRVGVVNKSLYLKALKEHGQEKVRYLNLGAASPNIDKDNEPEVELVDWRKRGSIDLCWVGRFDKDKNLPEFIDLINLLNLNYSLPVKGHVVGMQLKGDKFRASKTPQMINFHGWLSNPQELISKCDFLISTSLREGFGMLPLEAGFVATPTLGYSNSGTSISIPAAGGFLFEKHAYKEISIFLKEWAQLDSKERQKMRKHSREKTLQYFKSFNLEDEMVDLYRNLVAN